MLVKFKKLSECAHVPTRGTPGAAGYDLWTRDDQEQDCVSPGETRVYKLGFSVEIPAGTQLEVRSRSGLSVKGIVVANAPGTIDEDYRGEVGVILHNQSAFTFLVNPQERIAQVVLVPYIPMEFEEVVEVTATERGDGGFGSTGVK